jgi:hypothetical protein
MDRDNNTNSKRIVRNLGAKTGAQASSLAMPLKNGKRLFALTRLWQARTLALQSDTHDLT